MGEAWEVPENSTDQPVVTAMELSRNYCSESELKPKQADYVRHTMSTKTSGYTMFFVRQLPLSSSGKRT